ncbi:MAG: hypothetical protein K6E31_02810 [bacterium]|nr:hypothetical protein [bacterium]
MNKNEFHVGEGQQPVPLAAGALVDRHMIGISAFKMITAAGLEVSPGECLPGTRRNGVKCAGGGVGGYTVTETAPAFVYAWGDGLRGVFPGADNGAERSPVILLGRVDAPYHDAA